MRRGYRRAFAGRQGPDFCFRLELLVVVVDNLARSAQLLEQRQPGAAFPTDSAGKPDLVVDLGLFELQARALTQPEQQHAKGDGVEGFGLAFDPLKVLLVDPNLATKLGEDTGVTLVGPVAGPGRGFDYVSWAALNAFLGKQAEVKSVGRERRKET